jgi:signal transduction histidine kinase
MTERIVDSGAIVDSAINSVQRIASDLRPAALDTLGLAAAIAQETARFHRKTGMVVQTQLPEEPVETSTPVATAVYRTLQEALTNVVRHAAASEVRVELRADQAEVRLEVADNGRGIDSARAQDPRLLGLLGMRERASILGGALSVGPNAPRGTRVALRLPRQASDQRFWAEFGLPQVATPKR